MRSVSLRTQRCEVPTRVCMQTGVAAGKTLVDVVAMTATEDRAFEPAGHTAPRAALHRARRLGNRFYSHLQLACSQ